jgi:hypothetical protein
LQTVSKGAGGADSESALGEAGLIPSGEEGLVAIQLSELAISIATLTFIE